LHIQFFTIFFYVLCVIVVVLEETPRMGAADCFVPALKRPKSPTSATAASLSLPLCHLSAAHLVQFLCSIGICTLHKKGAITPKTITITKN